jgi:GSH-dependent disulfide-bond oxidoreductase
MASAPPNPIDVYFWSTPNGFKIPIMLEECGLPYAIHPVNIGKGEQFKPEFLAISPNNKIPAIVDPDGPGGEPIAIFESGAILQYLGRKTGRFYPTDERRRVEVDEWLFWQVGGLGPAAGQTHHFRIYAPERIPYATDRFVKETGRLYGVMDRRLADREFLTGDYSIADIACIGWAKLWERQGQKLSDLPNVKRWLDAVLARPAVQRGLAVKVEQPGSVSVNDAELRAALNRQKAR